ncbi:acyl carrier protein [Actinoplanes sp. NPDC051346]|uniref:acyl carrier protein n=1 Tax=Actinoplanes sp. NPDC051346 TaxID=3155048 RepID=UPI00341623A1
MDVVETKISQVLARVLANGVTSKELDLDADLVDDYGIDSLQMISLLLGIEDEFDLELDYESLQLDDLRSVRHFAKYVRELRGAAPE